MSKGLLQEEGKKDQNMNNKISTNTYLSTNESKKTK